MAVSPFRRFVGRVAAGALAVAVPVVLTPPPAVAAAAPTDLLISEYVEGSSNNKAVEIFNGTGAAVDLAGYSLQGYANGSSTPQSPIALSGTIASGDVHVIANTSAGEALKALADQLSGSVNFNGNDVVTLRKGTNLLDVVGQIGNDPGANGWGSTPTTTFDATLQRKATVCAGDPDGTDAFDPSKQWNGFARDTFSGLGTHSITTCDDVPPPADTAPTVASVTPAEGTTTAADANVVVTFSEPVVAPASAFTLTCAGAPAAFALSGGPTAFTLDPTAALPAGAACTVAVTAGAVSDVDTNDPPNAMETSFSSAFSVASATPTDPCTTTAVTIGSVQGSGETSPAAGQTRTVRGVVVADHEGPQPALRGLYLQDSGDGDAATSDGLFVFTNGANLASLGDVVTVTGQVSEFNGQTQMVGSAATVATCGTATATPATVTLPVASSTDLEKYEGMLVRFGTTLVVTEHFLLGRFGQVTMSGGDRLDVPTNVVAPGAEAIALQAKNNLNKILVDDTRNDQNADPVFGRGGQPLSASNTLRGGDTLPNATGVLTFTWGGASASPNAYRLRPVSNGGLFDFQPSNPRPTNRAPLGGDVAVGAMNLLNLFNTYSGCTGGVTGASLDCRGAENQVEYDRQVAKTVAAVTKVNADVLGINEIENDGYGATSTIQELVNRLNVGRAADDTYAFINPDTANGVDSLGSDAIKVGMIFKPGKVTPIGRTATLNTVAFVNGGDNGPRSRPSLAQAFRVNATGGTFVADVNHLKSKGSACNNGADTGDGQGNCNVARTNSAKELATWLKSDPTGTGETDALILGDLNSYAKEDPIRTLEEAGFTNLVAEYVGPDAYSYVFDGQWGYLDHALGSAGILSQVTGVTEYHINADEPAILDYNTNFKSAAQVASLYAPDEFRVSDHDPIVVGLKPNSAPTVSAAFADGSVACGTGNATLRVEFTDRDAADTHEAVVAWGDGSTQTVDPATSPLVLTHTYAKAGRYTATVTVTDSHGLSTTRTAQVSVEYASSGILPPLRSGATVKYGSTVPVKVAYTDCDGSVPTTLAPVVTVRSGSVVVHTGTATFADGEWKYELSTKRLPGAGTYTVTVTVPSTGQTDTATLTVRR